MLGPKGKEIVNQPKLNLVVVMVVVVVGDI